MTATRVPRSLLLSAVIATASVLVLTGCGSPAGSGSATSEAAAMAPIAAIPPAKNCADGLPPTASLDPGSIQVGNRSTWPQSPTLDKILKRKQIVVGTSGDVLLWGARNPTTGKLEGYDIDVLNAVAAALDVSISYKVINYGQRLTELQSKAVDLVAHTMTINCDRWQGTGNAPNAINFSTEYYRAGQRVLVRADLAVKRIEDLKGKGKVCVPEASTNVDNVEGMGLDLVQLPVVGDCLVQFQEGEVVAITGDDTVLAGFVAQDPYAKLVGAPFSAEPYGLGINAGDPGFTRFVNAVLEQLRSDGTLNRIYDRTMGVADRGAPALPKLVYGRKLPLKGRA